MDSWKDLFGTLAGETIKSLFKVIGQSPADAAATDLYLAASPEVESKWQKGKHFILIAREQSTSKLAEDKNLGKNLWYWCDDKVTQGEQINKFDSKNILTEECSSGKRLGRELGLSMVGVLH